MLAVPAPEGTLLRMFHALGLLRQNLEPYFAQYGISGPQWGILRIVQRALDNGEGALSQKEISRRLLIQPPSVTALVDRLERMGLLQRGASDDLRVRMVALTPAGRQLIAGIEKNHPARIAALFEGFTAAELQQFHGLLGTLGAHLAAPAPEWAAPAPELAAPAPLAAKISRRRAKARPSSPRLPRTK